MEWLIHSDAGLMVRLLIGCAIFGILASVDIYRNGPAARRWREYAFLLLCVAVALGYGILNDQLTVGLSWEYFYYGKDLMSVLGQQTPPDDWLLRLGAAKVGMKATWSAGLIIGVVLLFANNPGKGLPPLPFRKLLGFLPLMLLITVAGAVVLGIIGYFGGLRFVTSEFDVLIAENLWRPYRFMAVFGIHLGGYVGGLVGTIAVAIMVRRKRNVLREGAREFQEVQERRVGQ